MCVGYEWVLYHKGASIFINDMIIPYKIKQVSEAFEKYSKGIQRRFKCPHCDNDYASPSGRRRHVINTHPGISPILGRHDQIAGTP